MTARMLARRFGLVLVFLSAVSARRAAAQVYYVGPGRIVMYKVWSPYYGDQLYTYIIRPPMPYQPAYPYMLGPYRYQPRPIRPVPQRNVYLPPQRPRRYYTHPDKQDKAGKDQQVTMPPVARANPNAQLIVGDVNEPPAGVESVPEPNSMSNESAEAKNEKVTAVEQSAAKARDSGKRTSRKKPPRRKPTRYR